MTTTRRRIYRIPHAHILNFLRKSGIRKLAGKISEDDEQAAVVLPMPLNVPEGAVVASVQSNYSVQAFDFVVEHESFAEIADCAELPVIRLEMELFVVAHANAETDQVTPAAEVTHKSELKPAEVFSVGSVIQDELKARDWSLDELASKMGGAPYPRLLQLIRAQQGCPRIDLHFAQRLASAFGTLPEFWLRVDDTWHDNKGWAQ